MRKLVFTLCIFSVMLAWSILLLSCGQGSGSSSPDLVAFDALIADPQEYADQVLCTEGVQVDGFEASGLARSTYTKDGYRYLTEPVIWLEGADVQSLEDCTRTETEPSLEFCNIVVCGIFEIVGGYGHGGAYAYQLREGDVAMLPSPSVIPTPVSTVPPENTTPIAPESGSGALAVEPPSAIMASSGKEQLSGIGSFCWTQATAGEENGVGVCADMAGIPTAEEPLLVSSPFTATFRLAPEETPNELLLEVIRVTVKDEFKQWPAGWRGWAYKEGERYSLPLEREPSIELSLEPGLYVLNLTGWWQAWGDASYGFLVDVIAEATGIPSASHILFSYHRRGATELWTIDPANGTEKQQIRPEQTILDPALSPDSEAVAYIHMTGNYGGVVSELWLMDRDGGNPHSLYVPPAEQSVLSRPTWEPEGMGIYFLQLGSEAASGLLRVPADGGEPTLVLTDCLDFALAPDGDWLVSVSLDRGLTMWGWDGARLGDLKPQDSNLTDFDSLAVSPAGDVLAFRATDGDTWNLYVMDLDNLEVRRLTDLMGFHALEPSGGQVNGLAWTADGAHLVYSVDGDPDQMGIWRVDIRNRGKMRLFVWGEGEWAAIQGPWIESTLPVPLLAVDESAVVAAEVDGPGHVEYTERLGEQILTRIEGLRARTAEQELACANAALVPFGYRLEARLDAEWSRTFYDLYGEGDAEPMLAGLSQVWPVSVNASGTDFVLAAENAPNVLPLYLLVQSGGVEPWDPDKSAYLPPAYAGDALAQVTFTGFPTLTYQVELNHQFVYSGTAVAMGAYMPLRSFTTWNGHWALEVDDHLIVDGEDVGRALGYDAAFGFHLIHGQPFYFFQQDGQVRISYGGRTLPNVYDEVFHNQCCEAAMHNVQALGDAVIFHALWNGTWYFVEAGVYDGEMAGTYRYTAPEGWSFRYPVHWDRLGEELGFVQDTATGKTVTFASQLTTQAELDRWLKSEIDRKLAATEAKNTMAEPLTAIEEGSLIIYRYAILSKMDSSETLLHTTVFFDGQRRYDFHAAIPPLSGDEYQAVVDSFEPVPRARNEGR